MMMLSIIIVNYNVKYFLEQCLCSVKKALAAAELTCGPISEKTAPENSAEVFVVDNGSSDGSPDWLPPRFPFVQFILNAENRGYGAANNQALTRTRGKYVLFLNPDTILPEDVFTICLAFMESHPRAGAAGVRMIDGGGGYLKESKRGLPTPWAAFCKLSGLSAVFPRSRVFAGYYQGHLSPFVNQPAPVLSGAFLFVRKEALEKTGTGDGDGIGFDERFFLYAEDIDLSVRLEQAGYTNYYIADTTILHFKGESTKKDIRYVRHFYKAMSQFREKHGRGGRSGILNSLIKMGIPVRGGLEALRNFFTRRSLTSMPAGEIILYEGREHSFKHIIETLGKADWRKSKKQVYLIHAEGSSAAVGSFDKKQQGMVIKIK